MASNSIDLVSDTSAQHLMDATDSILDQFDGTAATYKKAMRRWFIRHRALEMESDSTSLTALCDMWYELTRDSWCGYTEFYQPDVSAVTYGTKGGDNAEMTCTPSTDTVANQDDYAGLPLFACVDCNWEVDADTLRPVITAIDGITPWFKRTDPTVYVGVLQMAGFLFVKEDSDTYTIGYAANRDIPYKDVYPLPDAVNPDDNSIRSWVVHAKYVSHTVNSKLTSCAGLIPSGFISHNTQQTLAKANGAQYSGQTTADDTFLKIMMMIKYGSLTMDGIVQGCTDNNYQYPTQVAEEGVRRVLISTSHNLEVGMGVLIGNYSSSIDRTYLYSITGGAGAIITKIETVTVNSTSYAAIYVDTDDTFDTAANGTATSGTTYISTFHWPTGTTDAVLGNDGSPVSCTSGKYPAKLQGIEYMNGATEILADVILYAYLDDATSTYYYEPYIVQKSANQSTSLTSNYQATGLTVAQPSATGWQYIKKLSLALGVLFPTMVGGSSSTYTRDAFYMLAKSTGSYEWLVRCSLNAGLAYAGLSSAYGTYVLSNGDWALAARISASGNRGEWAA